jgi:FlaA1/EpsC-like NDP-sugar epimerase
VLYETQAITLTVPEFSSVQYRIPIFSASQVHHLIQCTEPQLAGQIESGAEWQHSDPNISVRCGQMASLVSTAQVQCLMSYADMRADDRVVFVTGGAGSICSAQTRALVHLGANACIIGRNVEKTEKAAKEIALVRKGAKVLGIGAVDVRNVSAICSSAPRLAATDAASQLESLQKAADRCVQELGAIDFVM